MGVKIRSKAHWGSSWRLPTTPFLTPNLHCLDFLSICSTDVLYRLGRSRPGEVKAGTSTVDC